MRSSSSRSCGLTQLEAIRTFAGEDYETAVVPPKARLLLSRFDERSQHYEVRTDMTGQV